MDKNEFSAYFKVLEDTIEKKNQLLNELYRLTKAQEKTLAAENFSMEDFMELIDKKAPLIESVSEFDAGFQGVYDRIRPVIEQYKAEYEPRIKALQKQIKTVLEKGAVLCTLEEQNKQKLEVCLGEKKQEIKNFKRSSKTVSSYYKNMAGAVTDQSFFMDKKK